MPITMADVRSALCLIQLNQNFCTGWLLDDDGCVVTAGHFFQGSSLGSTVRCSDAMHRDLGLASLVEYEYRTMTVGVRDFALLKLQDKPPKTLRPLPFDRSKQLWGGQRFESFGFFMNGEDFALAPLRGSVDGPVYPKARESGFLCYRLKTDFDVALGYSGAPIVVDGEVVGIQSGRLDPDKGPKVGFAVPMQSVSPKTAACKTLQTKPNAWTTRMRTLVAGLPKVRLRAEEIERQVILVGPVLITTVGTTVVKLLCQDWVAWQAICCSPLDTWAWLALQPAIKLRPQTRYRNEDVPEPEAWRYYVGDDAVTPIPEHQQAFVRVLLDSEANMESTSVSSIPGLQDVTHGLVIHLRVGPSKFIRTGETLTIQEPKAELIIKRAFVWLENLLLDINVFHRSRILPAMFVDADTRRLFSELKLSFLVKQGLMPIDTAISLNSYSLAEFCRESNDGAISFEKYEHLWRGFIDDQLFVSMATTLQNMQDTTTNSSTETAMTEIIRRKLLEHPLLVGQLSTSKIALSIRKRRMDSSLAPLAGLCAFATTTRRPHLRSMRSGLAAALGYNRWRRNLSSVMLFDELRELVRYTPYIKLVLFNV